MSIDPSKRYYIAGPMSGRPQHNFPRFFEVADQLRAQGLQIVSPAEIDSEEVREAALESVDGGTDDDGKLAGNTWGDFLSRDIKIVADEVDGVIAFDEWPMSKGARLEVFTALQLGKPVFWRAVSGDIHPLSVKHAMAYINIHAHGE